MSCFLFLFLLPIAIFANTKITIIGDSISIGIGASGNYGYVQRLQDRYIAEGKDIIIYNRSYGGALTETLFQRGITTISTEMPDYIVIFLGTNDANINVPEKILLFNFFEMLSRCNPNCKRVILAGLDTSLFKPEYNIILSNVYSELLSMFNLYPIMLLGTDIHPYCPDHFHPNDTGHQIIADKLYNALLECGLSE